MKRGFLDVGIKSSPKTVPRMTLRTACNQPNHAKPKILMILECWEVGGTEKYVQSLCRYLQKQGSAELYLYILKGPQAGDIENIQSVVRNVFYPQTCGLSRFCHLWNLIKSLDPDVCHTHLYSNYLMVSVILRMANVPLLVSTLHMPITAWNLRNRLMWKVAIKLSDKVISNSNHVARSVGFDTARNDLIIPPSIEVDDNYYKGQVLLPHSSFIVCGCGRLSKEKDWPTLLRAFAELSKKVDRPVKCQLIGIGSQEEELRGLVFELELDDHVEFLGRLEHSEVLGVMRKSDVFVLPSHFEGLGIVAIEAMQCGVPTITANFEASKEYIEEGVTGFRFPSGDWKRLSELLLDIYLDPGHAQTIGARGRAFVRDLFSEANTVAKYQTVFFGGG